MRIRGSIDDDILSSEMLVMGPTENIIICTRVVIKTQAVSHFFNEGGIEKHRLDTGHKGDVFECVSTSIALIES